MKIWWPVFTLRCHTFAFPFIFFEHHANIHHNYVCIYILKWQLKQDRDKSCICMHTYIYMCTKIHTYFKYIRALSWDACLVTSMVLRYSRQLFPMSMIYQFQHNELLKGQIERINAAGNDDSTIILLSSYNCNFILLSWTV